MEGKTHQRGRYGLPMDVCLHVESRKRLDKGVCAELCLRLLVDDDRWRDDDRG